MAKKTKTQGKKDFIHIRVESDLYERLKEMAGIAPLAFYVRLVLDQHTRTPLKIELTRRAS